MKENRLNPQVLRDRIIDCHAHIGVSLKAYGNLEYPYAQTLESLYAKRQAVGVDVNVIFPFTPDLHFDLKRLISEGINHPDPDPVSRVPYGLENTLIMHELFRFKTYDKHDFIPFISADPERAIADQVRFLESLEQRYPIYGIKLNTVLAQAHVSALSDQGAELLDFARSRNIPFLCHASPVDDDQYANAGDILRIAGQNPDIRFCLAHALIFHKAYLDQADQMPNVWVDTAALKIQVDLSQRDDFIERYSYETIDTDFSDHRQVMLSLMREYPETIIWGSDAPAYSYCCRRKHNDHEFRQFELNGTYRDEKAALDFLPHDLKWKAANHNPLHWLFGEP